ncbi:hypothetical protein VB737_04725, partial [Synechococcus sp. BA-120 BA3]|nr:hypothetical protein [Synechococcus sp. BA-120 BA3]
MARTLPITLALLALIAASLLDPGPAVPAPLPPDPGLDWGLDWSLLAPAPALMFVAYTRYRRIATLAQEVPGRPSFTTPGP